MGAEGSTLNPFSSDSEAVKKLEELKQSEFADSIRSVYARRYLTSSQRIYVRDATNGLTIEPFRKTAINRYGENVFETELYVMVIPHNPSDMRYLFPVEKNTNLVQLPKDLVMKGENFEFAAKRLLHTLYEGFTFDLNGILRIEFTPTPLKTRILVIYEAIFLGESETFKKENNGDLSFEWLGKKEIAKTLKKKSIIARNPSAIRQRSLPGVKRQASQGDLGQILSNLIKWMDSRTYAFPVSLLKEFGGANESLLDSATNSKVQDMLKGNKYAYRSVLCCRIGKGNNAKVLVHKKSGLPKRNMMICISFEDIAQDLLNEVCDLYSYTGADLDGIVELSALHCNIDNSIEHGNFIVTYLSIFPEDILHVDNPPDDYAWITLDQAAKHRAGEFELIKKCIEAPNCPPRNILTNEKNSYEKLSPCNLLPMID